MKIAGLQKLSLIDYPKIPAAVIFTQGCNMRCPYCHNRQLVDPNLFENLLNEEEIFEFLNKRIGLLKGIVITGGEPTIQKDLVEFILKIKRLGFLVKLDTNGTNPNVLQELISKKLIDFIAMDIKADFAKYSTFFNGDLNLIKLSVDIIKASGIIHLFRTTYDKDLLQDKDLLNIKNFIDKSDYIIQECNKYL
ncbi:MAG: anaerobic ribonucleoside-triphosphate reductase activating protein [Endomicrobium sp.]|jgi:pyruvate formate lyase activating enzyme|uniref:anaerobic ribonucleoside-triphosphate reductase activating protein n=1 Tax=Candidatus Endomicrobiellum cubanum TaxID=3242325 RepID=UPI00281D99A3|nr:anaerobic ribonucleoside-triphosphate reductase activating protein [Endomicrobium sp.]MDR2395563.1 anaerobic ribonucleoside-triphosphate reductase activating protein [Endomicrobium sp.]